MNIIYENPKHPHIVKGPPCHAFVAVKDVLKVIESNKDNYALAKAAFALPKHTNCKECSINTCKYKEIKNEKS